MSSPIAIIAGAGRFPFHVAQEAKRQGHRVVVLGMTGWADRALAAHADAFEEVSVGQLARLIERLKSHRVTQAIMAGKVTKEVLVTQRSAFDVETLALLASVRDVSVPALLGAIGLRLSREGITLLDSSTFLKEALCPAGVLTARAPTEEERKDIGLGARAARAIADLDIGQTVVVKRGVIVAVEALEGTDAAIRRAHAVAGEGLVVVKMAATTQDRRFDLPVIGLDTLATLQACGVTCLAMEAGSTVLLDRPTLIAQADTAQRVLVGITHDPPT